MTVELYAYGDESGIDGHGPYCVVAGFIGSPRKWGSFNKAWGKIIEEAGVKEFHAQQFFNRRLATEGKRNPFRDWPESKATKFLDDLLAVIKQHKGRISPAGCSLNVQDFLSFTWGERQYLTGGIWDSGKSRFVTNGAPSRVYPLPLHGFIGDALTHARPDDCKVHFVFDEQRVMQEGILQTIAQVRKAGLFDKPVHQKVGVIGFDDSESWPGIQAGDMLAHLLYSNSLRKEKLTGERRRALVSIMGERWRLSIWTRQKLQRNLDSGLPPGALKQIRAVKSPAEIQQAKKKRP